MARTKRVMRSKHIFIFALARERFCGSFDVEKLTRAGVSDHLDAAAVAGLQWRLVPRQGRVVERVLAADVTPAVALVAVDGPCCYQKSSH